MLKSKPLALSLICIFCFVLVGFLFIIFNEKGQAQQNNQQNKQTATVLRRGAPAANQELKQPTKKELDDAATPVVDYSSLHTEPVSSERIAKNARYDGRKFLTVAPTFTSPESIVFGHGMSDLPADESNLIIEGKVADSAAYLSNDKGIVYSEFTVRVTDLVKQVQILPLIKMIQS
jgi:hypothetical protein